MGMIKCPECGKEISENATSCPNCGSPVKKQPQYQGPIKMCKHCKEFMPKSYKVCPKCGRKQGGILKWFIIGFVVLIIIGAAASGGSDEDKPKKVENTKSESDKNETTQNDKDDNNSNNKKDKAEEVVFRKGETAEMNGVQITLTDYQESAGGEWNKPTDGNVFLMAEFEISNNSDDELAVSSIMSFEAYADDYSLNYSVSALLEKEGNQLDGTIAAGKKMKGWIGWEVPQDYKKVEINFTDNVWSNNKFKFVIDK